MFFIFPIVFEILFVVVFIVILTSIVKSVRNGKTKLNSENNDKSFKNTISNANDDDSFGNSVSSEPTEIYCEYCGSKYNKHKRRCPSCGARIQKKN